MDPWHWLHTCAAEYASGENTATYRIGASPSGDAIENARAFSHRRQKHATCQ